MNIKNILEQVKNIKEVSDMGLDKINAKIEKATEKALQNILKWEGMAEKEPLMDIKIETDRTVTNYIREETGLYLEYKYNYDKNEVTACFDGVWGMFCGLKKQVYQWYIFKNAEVKADKISMQLGYEKPWSTNGKASLGYGSPFNKEEVEPLIIQHFKNGKVVLKSTPELVEIISIINGLENKYNPKKEV